MAKRLFALAVAFLVSGCGSGGPTVSVAATNVGAEESTYRFDPETLQVPGGATIVVKNTGDVEHDFTIENTNVRIYLGVGQTSQATISLVPGTYTYYCSIVEGRYFKHRELGMVGTLTVK